jgi:hypothetical protein
MATFVFPVDLTSLLFQIEFYFSIFNFAPTDHSPTFVFRREFSLPTRNHFTLLYRDERWGVTNGWIRGQKIPSRLTFNGFNMPRMQRECGYRLPFGDCIDSCLFVTDATFLFCLYASRTYHDPSD